MRDQFGVQFDGERDQAERLIAFALFTSIYQTGAFWPKRPGAADWFIWLSIFLALVFSR